MLFEGADPDEQRLAGVSMNDPLPQEPAACPRQAPAGRRLSNCLSLFWIKEPFMVPNLIAAIGMMACRNWFRICFDCSFFCKWQSCVFIVA